METRNVQPRKKNVAFFSLLVVLGDLNAIEKGTKGKKNDAQSSAQ